MKRKNMAAFQLTICAALLMCIPANAQNKKINKTTHESPEPTEATLNVQDGLKRAIPLLQESAPENTLTQIQELVLSPNQHYQLTSPNSHFPVVTMHSGSVFEIRNEQAHGKPFRLEIGKLILKPGGAAALISFFNANRVDVDGANGDPGENGVKGTRSGNTYVHATAGKEGEKGDDGHTISTRGVLYLSIQEIEVVPSAPLTKAILSIDGKGIPGGRGGDGGKGGSGGKGAPGQNGKHDCDMFGCQCTRQIISGGPGGDGGPGGQPGNGGTGGNGATILFSGPDAVFAAIQAIAELDGGTGGEGGNGGAGGNGGDGAPRYAGGGGHCGGAHAAKPDGNSGEHLVLIKGKNGAPGQAGTLKKVSTFPAYDQIMKSLVDQAKTSDHFSYQ